MYQPQKTEQMYKRDKQKMSRNPPISQTIPSFSSSLLDEIYKSIDQNENFPNSKCLKNRVLEKQRYDNVCVVREYENPKRRVRDDEIESMRRAYLIENWIKKNKLDTKLRQPAFENNPLSFGSSSSSSGSNSSLETPKKIKTSKRTKKPKSSSNREEGEVYFLENYHNLLSAKNNQGGRKNDDDLIKSKSRALKIYNNLKKIKQPISPGGRLTSFLNSFFNNGVSKKTKSLSPSISMEDSTCSSASSYTRSCMSRNSSQTNRRSSHGEKRSVSFYPMSVIIDEDNRTCGHKYVHKGDFKENEVLSKKEYVKGNGRFDNEEDDDMASDTSSDLFELNHLDFVGNNSRYFEELPVYETTRFHANIAIANRLVR